MLADNETSFANGAYDKEGDLPPKELPSEGTARLPSFVEYPRMKTMWEKMKQWAVSQRTYIKHFFHVVLFILYQVFLAFVLLTSWDRSPSWCEGAKFLLVLTAIAYFLLAYYWILKPCFRATKKKFFADFSLPHSDWIRRIWWLGIYGAVLVFIFFDTSDNRNRLISLGGLVVLIFLGFLGSNNRSKIRWGTVFSGVLIQFFMGMIVLRWPGGRSFVACLGEKVATFLSYTDEGSRFVFGYLIQDITIQMNSTVVDVDPVPRAIFAFKVLPTIVFFSFVTSILFYYGILQIIVIKVGWMLQILMGTTAAESMNAAASIFLGMTESPIMIRPYISRLTNSELHAVMTGGFATIAGGVMAAFISMGISPSHLLSASVMSAPAALAFAKLLYPEDETSVTNYKDIKIEKGAEKTVLEAASNAAVLGLKLAGNIVANLIAFIAFIYFLDQTISWLGDLAGLDYLSFNWLLSKILTPLAVIMGVEWKDAENVAKLIGYKTLVNEFVAYGQLSEMIKRNVLSERSESIATYALCGFSNIASIGVQIGGLGGMAPERKADLAAMGVRAMIAGSAACFMTACIAGTLLSEA